MGEKVPYWLTHFDDLNNDGFPDAIRTTGNGHEIYIYWNSNGEELNAASPIPVELPTYPNVYPTDDLIIRALIDIDQDGFQDVFLHRNQATSDPFYQSDFMWLKNNGDMSFDPVPSQLATTTWIVQDFDMGDFDGDGDADFVVLDHDDGSSAAIINNGLDEWSVVDHSPQSVRVNGVGNFFPGNGDDILAYAGYIGCISNWVAFSGMGNGTFNSIPSLVHSNGGSPQCTQSDQRYVVDCNQDGLDDFFFRDLDSEEYRMKINQGDSTFIDSVLIANFDFLGTCLPHDFDQDGQLDYSSISLGRDTISWISGDLEQKQILDVSQPYDYHASQVQVIDFNADGQMDILYAAPDGIRVAFNQSLSWCSDPEACNFDSIGPVGEPCIYTGCIQGADSNDNGEIDVADVLAFLSNFPCLSSDCSSDLNGDSQVNIYDLNQLLLWFGNSIE